jgi:putative ABC transport system substrate-binding protein
MPVIGFMSARSLGSDADLVAAFRKGLGAAGLVEGSNVKIEYRWADGDYNQLPGMALELIAMKISLLVAAGGARSALAAKAATSTIPIVFMGGIDPVRAGLVASINRPGGNATGVDVIAPELAAKRINLLRELVPNAKLIGVLVNPSNDVVTPYHTN